MDAVLQLDEENMEAAADGQPPPNTEAEFAKVAFECSIRHKWSRAAVATSWKVVPCSTPYYRILRLVGTPEQGKGAGCIVIDTDSKAVYASPAVETELGYSTSEMATRGITLDRLIPGATAGLHGMLLKGFLRRRTVPSQDVPCFNNHVVSLVSKKKTLVPFRMAWRNQREGEDVSGKTCGVSVPWTTMWGLVLPISRRLQTCRPPCVSLAHLASPWPALAALATLSTAL